MIRPYAGLSTNSAIRSTEIVPVMRNRRLSALAVEIHDLDPGVRIMGQLSPAATAEVEAQRDDGTVAGTTGADALGRFRLELERGGRLRLVIRRAAPAPPVETSWLDA